MKNESKHQVVIIGGGTAGITLAAQLDNKIPAERIAVVDPANVHYYQPIWTLVGAGVVPKEVSVREEKPLIPKGVHFIQEAVVSIHPEERYVLTDRESKINYDYLVVAPGLQLDWNKVKGLEEAIGKGGVVSNYAYEYVDKTWEALKNFRGGNAVFTHPNTPVKCGGAPQKIMYLADDYFRKSGVREKTKVFFYSANKTIFDVEKYAKTLNEVIKRKDIITKFRTDLIEVRSDDKEAVFEYLDSGETETVKYDMLHVTPPMSSPRFIKESPLANNDGWVEVDPYTLQHKRYENVFSLGDAAALPTSKTGAAIRKQAPVVVENLFSLINGKPLTAKYNGYTSCPLVTGYGRLILAEFDYDKKPQETFPFDQSKERYTMYLLKKELLPRFYWYGMLRGKM